MANIIKGDLTLSSKSKIGIVVSRFNSTITSALLSGAEDSFIRHGGDPDKLTIVWVPGAFEIPSVVRRIIRNQECDGVLALGCLIKGSTSHFDVLADSVTEAMVNLTVENDTPISFGILTTATLEQAFERAGTKAGNKGAEAMESLIEMVNLERKLS